MAELLERIRALSGRPLRTKHRGKEVPFVLECEALPPTAWDPQAIESKLTIRLPDDMRDLWNLSGGLRLFEDVFYGQWGLRIWSAQRTLEETLQWRERRRDFIPGDLVTGEFLGDADLLVIRCDPGTTNYRTTVIALPMDPRDEWPIAAPDLETFIRRYIEAESDKFWETAPSPEACR